MTIDDFNALDEVEQAHVALQGVFLDHRVDGQFPVLLYDCGGFYVEMRYSMDFRHIVSLNSFTSTRHLRPYLDEMNNDAWSEL